MRQDKFIPFNRLASRMQTLHECGLTIVATGGVFDLLHVGHVRSLQFAASLGGVLIVLLNSDESAKRLKGPKRPIVLQEERVEMLAALECVSYVTIFQEDTPESLIRMIRPNIWVKSKQYAFRGLAEAVTVRQYGGIVRLAPHSDGYSTTDLCMKIVGNNG